MADLYVNTDTKNLDPQNNSGAGVKRSIITTEILTSYTAGSVIRLFKNINSTNTLSQITILCDAITSAVITLGYYKPNGGAAVSANALATGQSLATASKTINGMANVAIENVGQRHHKIAFAAGATTETLKGRQPVYDIALTITTAATVAGTITVILDQECN